LFTVLRLAASSYVKTGFPSPDPAVEFLEHGLRSSNIVVVILSRALLNRPNILFELGAASSMGKRVVMIAPSELGAVDVPPFFSYRAERILTQQSPDEAAEIVAQAAKAA
jgi:hypothetical protein